MSEANARIIIDKFLREAGWVLPGDDGAVNVEAEMPNREGVADYVLKDRFGFALCVVEAKNEQIDPLAGKEQARRYANALNCRFAILSNGASHYLWDIKSGSPQAANVFPSQEQLELTQKHFDPPRRENEKIDVDYIARTQMPALFQHPDYLNPEKRGRFLECYKLRLLRDYQLQAVLAVQRRVRDGYDRFLLEMATGTGKTLTSAAIIKMFLRCYKVRRVLFLVDRIELELQAKKVFDDTLKNDYQTVIWKENRQDWTTAEIVVSTVQSFLNKYRKVFRPEHFGLVISDEAHRSIGAGKSRSVFEYFIGFKLGLTATPKDYLKSVETLPKSDQRQMEKRQLLDTYTTFGCENGEPTFRYALADGVRDGHLVQPKVIDVQTGITTELLSKQGYLFVGEDDEGQEFEATFTTKDFEKKFFSENANRIFCQAFLEKAKKDPYTGEIGKTLVFCVSQNHAAKITQILNELADRVFTGKYRSDFAMQVTSSVQDAQRMTTLFSNNQLSGESQKFGGYYKTSQTRVCVTVGMMSTGYDCTDLLNICMMRPVRSPSEFIQMKGRGTRICDFSQYWIREIPQHIEAQKKGFLLFDFFGNYKYFEEDFDYDEVLKLPAKYYEAGEGEKPPNKDSVISTDPDWLSEWKEIEISEQGMKVDRDFYRSFERKVFADATIESFVKQQNFDEAESYLNDNILNRPREFFTMAKLGKALGLDRRLTVAELLRYVFGQIAHIPSQQECLDEEFARLCDVLRLNASDCGPAKEVFDAYALDEEFREIIENKQFAELFGHSSGEAFRILPQELREAIPAYIKQHVNLERLENA